VGIHLSRLNGLAIRVMKDHICASVTSALRICSHICAIGDQRLLFFPTNAASGEAAPGGCPDRVLSPVRFWVFACSSRLILLAGNAHGWLKERMRIGPRALASPCVVAP
jgi:hypothetical protein